MFLASSMMNFERSVFACATTERSPTTPLIPPAYSTIVFVGPPGVSDIRMRFSSRALALFSTIWRSACALAVAMTDASKLSDLISRAICRICVCVAGVAPRRLMTCSLSAPCATISVCIFSSRCFALSAFISLDFVSSVACIICRSEPAAP